jgi:hypothetical protein
VASRQIALALNPWMHIASNYRRCLGRLILKLLPQDPAHKLVLSLDRTEWTLGQASINLLFIGVAHQGPGVVLPG